MKTVEITVEPMTEAAFAPFGQVIDAPEHPTDYRPMFPVDFQCDGRPTINVIWQPQASMSFSRLERHFGVTQTFIQLSGAPAVVCAALPTDLGDPTAIPRPENVRAFLIDPAKGFAFARGTWHSLDRYLLDGPGATFVILNVDPNPTQIVDYSDGTTIRYQDLDVDQQPRRGVLEGDFGVEFCVKP